MALSLYEMSVPVFRRYLTNVDAFMSKAEAWARDNGRDPEAFLEARLAPDMNTFARQIQSCSDTSKGPVARLTGQPSPVMDDSESNLAELHERLARTIAYLDSVTPEMCAGDDDRQVELKTPNNTFSFRARDYITGFALPNFFFHVSAAYMILRNQGAPVGKLDYLGGV
ncbi:MAG: DUF1993 domain-containing protein [Caulobacteraceae bacterium]|nr:DUF1993 domain-containing protein [Caulobacteraceae bacterium]